MKLPTFNFSLSFLALLFAVTNCGGGTTGSTSAGSSTAASQLSQGGNTTVTCGSPNGIVVSTLSPNLIVHGVSNVLSLRFENATPSNAQVGINSWNISILDNNQQAIGNANITLVRPWMPEHGHGATLIPSVSNNANGYQIGNIDFFMPGLWQMQFEVQAGNQNDLLNVYFCLGG